MQLKVEWNETFRNRDPPLIILTFEAWWIDVYEIIKGGMLVVGLLGGVEKLGIDSLMLMHSWRRVREFVCVLHLTMLLSIS